MRLILGALALVGVLVVPVQAKGNVPFEWRSERSGACNVEQWTMYVYVAGCPWR